MAGDPDRARWTVSLRLDDASSILTLNINAPFLRAKVERLERALLAETLGLVDELVASIVSLTRVPFRVLVCAMM